MTSNPDAKPKREQVHFEIAPDVKGKLELLLWDPVRQRPRYGARSRLINHLLRQWLATLPSGAVVEDIIEGLEKGE